MQILFLSAGCLSRIDFNYIKHINFYNFYVKFVIFLLLCSKKVINAALKWHFEGLLLFITISHLHVQH